MYSQNAEEKYILEFFKDHNTGTFLSIGENDGETLSNVRALALKGFCGVMVEPSPTAFGKLKNLYSNEKKGCFYLYNCAIGVHNGKATLHDSGSLLKTGDTSLVSTLVPEEKQRFQSVLSYTEIEVQVFRWKTFYNRLSIKTFDCISIDAESMDIEILKQMDIETLSAKMIIVEWNSRPELHKAYSEILNNFRIIYTSPENLIFVK